MEAGFKGRIGRVDLTNGSARVEELEEKELRRYFGGTGLIASYLLREMKAGVEPLSPENVLVFSGGPLTGAPFAGSGRSSVGARSPLTGGFGTAEGGGFFGAEMSRAGFNALIITGKSDKPAYIFLRDGEIEIRDASSLRGKTTFECEEMIHSELGDKLVRISQCGVAGENLVRFAGIANDISHYAGRTGLGAVMGSKNLRAVAVRGTKQVPIHDKEKMRELSSWMNAHWKDLAYGLYDSGTAGGVMSLNAASGLPTRNFRQGSFEGASKISGQTMRDTILTGRGGCYACPIRCKREVTVEARGVDPAFGGPEYETVASFGSLCGIDDLGAIAKANQICNAYGMDTISAGVSIAFAMDCFENGILTLNDVDGLELRFGNAEAMLAVVEKIVNKEGIGAILAEGVVRAAKEFGRGSEEFAMHVKGQEIPMHEPRYKWGLGVGYGMSVTGADHMHNMHDPGFASEGPSVDKARSLGVTTVPLPAQDLSLEKVNLLRTMTNMAYFDNCGLICMFVPWTPIQKAEIARAISGWSVTPAELLAIGERAHVLARMFNLREGLGAGFERLPRRFFEAFKEGPLAGKVYDDATWDRAKLAYYRMSGWTDQGVPTPETLSRLGIGWAASIVGNDCKKR